MNLFFKSFIAATVAAIAFSTVSFAASYNNGKVGVTYADTKELDETVQNDMLTVMVVKEDVELSNINADSILYLDQGTGLSTFLAAGSSQFGVKGGVLEAGTYAMYIGATSMENPTVQHFTVATADSEGNTVTSSTGVEFVTKTKEASGTYTTADEDNKIANADTANSHSNQQTYDYVFLVNIGNVVNKELFDYSATLKYESNDKIYSAAYDVSGAISNDIQINGDASAVYGVIVKGVPTTCENFRIEPSVSAKSAGEAN